MTKDLTEQWKKGELKEGDYFYVKTKMGNIFTDCIDYDRPHWDGFKNDVEEILAPVPSYEEWKNITNTLDYEYKGNLTLRKENAKLKELLKECREIFNRTAYTHSFDIVAKIDEVLK